MTKADVGNDQGTHKVVKRKMGYETGPGKRAKAAHPLGDLQSGEKVADNDMPVEGDGKELMGTEQCG